MAQKMPDGTQIKISSRLKSILEQYNITAEDGWRFIAESALCRYPVECWGKQIWVMAKGPLVAQLCFEDVKCRGPQITIMLKEEIGDMVHILKDVSLVDDPVCICPEGDCPGMIGSLPPGIFLKDSATYVSFEKLLEKIPESQKKAFMSMLEKMKMEK